MLDERIRLRLQQLNRKPLPLGATNSSRGLNKATRALQLREVKPIPGLIRQADIVANFAGEHLRVRLPVDDIWPGGEQLITRRLAFLGEQESQRCDELGLLVNALPDDALLLDLETCGFAGSPLFLVGILRRIRERFKVELLLARNYAEERAVLTSFWKIACRHRVLVTFNGKSFDWPMVLDRSTRHLLFREIKRPELLHVDLLHHSRRRWQGELPDCKLQTLERHICGRGRVGDIPGGEIPAAYQQYVLTGFQREMNAILLHNAIDLVTLLDLAMRLAGP